MSNRWMNGVFLVAIFTGISVCQEQSRIETSWTPAVYRGLTIGASTKADAIQVLGKPRFSGTEQDTGLPIMSFAVLKPVPGALTVYLKDGIVDGMTLIPEKQLTRKEAIRVWGSDYVRVRYASDDCLTDGGTAPIYESPDGPIEHLEYRARGQALILHDGFVTAIAFVGKPFGPIHSRCSVTKSKPRAHR